MVDLQFVDFALMPGFFRNGFYYFLMNEPSCIIISVLPHFFEFHNVDRPLFGDLQNFYSTRVKQEISTFLLSDRNCQLLVAVM